ncbi:MAG TPA: hypothetical protein VJ373_04995, partial [Desulfatiglandales bacterium]|nr:hypothetical protein [Desulfatiglandales bacterium]
MLFKHSSRFITLLVLILFTIGCDSSPQKTEIKESTKDVVSEAPPLTITVEVTGGTIEGAMQDGIF